MNKYIFENDDSEVGGSVRFENDLILSIPGKSAEEIINILKDPKNFKGIFVIYKDETNFINDVFGLGGAHKDIPKNKEIYNKHNPPLWQQIEDELGKKFTQFYEKPGFKFPIKTKDNIELVKTSKLNPKSGKTGDIEFTPEKISQDKIKIKTLNKSSAKTKIEKILKNAGISDYSLTNQEKLDENIKKYLKNLIKKTLNEIKINNPYIPTKEEIKNIWLNKIQHASTNEDIININLIASIANSKFGSNNLESIGKFLNRIESENKLKEFSIEFNKIFK